MHLYCKVTIILRKIKNVKETNIMRQMKYFSQCHIDSINDHFSGLVKLLKKK